MVSSANPPRVSNTIGMNSTPAERQADRWAVRTPIDLQSVARGGGSCVQGLLLERGDDGDVQCRGATTAPGGEEYVCRPGLGVGYHTGSLSRWCQGRRPGSEEQDFADGVVASNPVPVASTPHLVASKRGPLCCGTLGSNNWCCGVALPASTAGSSGTPDLGGGAPRQWMAHHSASLQHEAALKSGPVHGHGWREQMTEGAAERN